MRIYFLTQHQRTKFLKIISKFFGVIFIYNNKSKYFSREGSLIKIEIAQKLQTAIISGIQQNLIIKLKSPPLKKTAAKRLVM